MFCLGAKFFSFLSSAPSFVGFPPLVLTVVTHTCSCSPVNCAFSRCFAFLRAGKHLKMLLDSPVMSNFSSSISGGGNTMSRSVRKSM